MGLDATVYCNCFETGKLRTPPPEPSMVYVSPDGSLECKSDVLDKLLEFDKWLQDRACEHEDGSLLHHYLGNIATIALLHKELSRTAEEFPLLLNKVLYNGTHCGDWLSLDEVTNLRSELNSIAKLKASTGWNQEFIDNFKQQMQELVDVSTSVNKPISF